MASGKLSPRSLLAGKRWLAIVALTVVLAIGAGCGDDDDDAAGSATTAAGANEITVTMSDELSFEPDETEVQVDQPVRLSFQNSGTALHDFTVEEVAVEDVMSEGSQASPTGGHGMATASPGGDASSEFDLHLAVDGGASGMLEFTPTEAGEYQFMCTVTGHAEGGMTGTLVVTD